MGETSITPPQIAPVATPDRIESLDVIRGVAVLGILLMNIIAFAMPAATYYNPGVMGLDHPANLWSYIINWLFFEGSLRTIFSMLFGAGVVLMTSRAEERGAGVVTADLYFRRNLLLMLFGLIDAYLFLWYSDILYVYGLAGLFLFVFRRLTPRTLFVIAMVMVLLLAARNFVASVQITDVIEQATAAQQLGERATPEQVEALAYYEALNAEYAPTAEAAAAEVAIRRSGYLEQLNFIIPVNIAFQSEFTYTYALWDVLTMMLLGMALMKYGVFSAARSWRFYMLSVVCGYGIGVPINWYEIRMAMDTGFSLEWVGLPYIQTYQLGRLATAAGHIGLVMLWCKASGTGLMKNALAAVGRMALTNYLSHSLFGLILFTGVGLAWFGQLQRYELYFVVLAIWAFQLVTSPLWLRYFRFGPVEWLWRSLTYGSSQPLRRRTSDPSPSEPGEARHTQ